MNAISGPLSPTAPKRTKSGSPTVTEEERQRPLTVTTRDGRQFTLTPYGKPVNVSNPVRSMLDVVVDSCRTQLPENQSAPGGDYNLVILERDGSGTCAATTAPILPHDLPQAVQPNQLTPEGFIRREPLAEAQSSVPQSWMPQHPPVLRKFSQGLRLSAQQH